MSTLSDLKKNHLIKMLLPVPVAALYFFFPTFISVSHAALLVLLIIFVIKFDLGRFREVAKCLPVLWLLALIYAVVIVGALYTSAETGKVLEHLGKYARFIYPIMLVTVLWNKPYLQKIALRAFMAGMMFIVVSAWLGIWFVLPWSASKTIGWGQNHYVIGDHITQNVMMAFFVILAVHYGLRSQLGRLRFFWFSWALLALTSITHLSHGRTGLFVLLAGGLAYAIMFFNGKRLILILSALFLLGSAAVITSPSMRDRLSLAFAEAEQSDRNIESSVGHRLYNYKITPLLIAEAPLFGHGTAAYHSEICRFVQPADRCEVFHRHPHNQFLFMAADHGLLGAGLYALLVIMLFVNARKSAQPDLRLLLCAFAAILLADSLVNTPFYSSRESQFFSYMMALLLSMSGASREGEKFQ